MIDSNGPLLAKGVLGDEVLPDDEIVRRADDNLDIGKDFLADLSGGIDRELPGFRKVVTGIMQGQFAYRYRPLDVETLYIGCTEVDPVATADFRKVLRSAGPSQGWEAQIPRLTLRVVEGATHEGLMHAPHDTETARHIAAFAARPPGGSGTP
jgi:hypothetical protein